MITLYHFSVSHYCEKVRWALLHKRIPHKCKVLLPGLHRKKMEKVSGQSSVPVLTDGKHSIAGSMKIMSYLDEEYPRFSLTPENQADAERALEWEQWADDEIGPSVRVLMYSVLTQYPDVLVNIMGQGGPWYTPFYLKKAMPKIIKALQAGYGLDDENVSRSKDTLEKCVVKVQSALGDNKYLVGNSFSRADLAVSALLAPVFRVSKYGLDWPQNMPEELFEIESNYEGIRPWVESIYLNHHA